MQKCPTCGCCGNEEECKDCNELMEEACGCCGQPVSNCKCECDHECSCEPKEKETAE